MQCDLVLSSPSGRKQKWPTEMVVFRFQPENGTQTNLDLSVSDLC
jgi:hypothetical protein